MVDALAYPEAFFLLYRVSYYSLRNIPRLMGKGFSMLEVRVLGWA